MSASGRRPDVPSPPLPTGTGPGACDVRHGCITCSDEGVPMTVVRLHDAGLAVCEGEDGARQDVLTGLVPDAAPGDRLLVHAGTALLRLESR
ncbi:MAG: HypC/HybG/HupF family hydrogenase formation chaperone [Actinobacteria bacterium]|nr:HypC/HybG/HupF family hydrogenase formation chaperone [Actinomycetota bacterium]